MIFSKQSLGVEISHSGVAFALMGGKPASPRLERIAYRPFAPGVLRISLREQNILDEKAFSGRV